MKRWSVLVVCISSLAFAGAPDQFAAGAGPRPDAPEARAAVVGEMAKQALDASDLSRLRFTSGPSLATGVNYADGREQAWLMCVVAGTANPKRGAFQLDTKPILLRNKGDHLEVVPIAAWKDSDVDC
jgi:hypothetical protein